jgi:hypothetical protein
LGRILRNGPRLRHGLKEWGKSKKLGKLIKHFLKLLAKITQNFE